MINEDFVTYEIALMLKKAGFDWDTDSYYGVMLSEQGEMLSAQLAFEHNDEYEFCNYHERVSAPTLAQAQKWLRKRGLCVSVYPSPHSEDIDGEYAYKVYEFMDYEEWNDPCAEYSKDYESALSAGIEAALKLIEEGE